MQISEVSIGKFYLECLSKPDFHKVDCGSYELLECPKGIEIRTIDNKFVPIKYLSRHKTTKDMVKVNVESISEPDKKYEIVTTTDHNLMVLNDNHFFERISVTSARSNEIVSIYDEDSDSEKLGRIVSFENLGKTEDWVYDVEVDSDSHAFYGNDVYIHNSQFVNIKCVTDWMRQKYHLPEKIFEWSDEMKLKLWKFMDGFVEGKVNKFVQNLVKEYCHTEHPEVLRYSLEYIADCGIYEQRKHYICRKIVSEGPEIVDKVKVTGIELKKATIPVAVKDILKDIYYNTLKNDWTNDDFNKYLLEAYEKFLKLSIDDVSIWKGWSSDKISSTGFLQTGKGMTGISKACHYYNDLINHLGIGKKYDELRTGGKYKFVYLNPNNAYGIDCLAFVDGQYPKEFEGIFAVDYQLMFEKLIKDPLRSFLEATGFVFKDPRERELCELDEL